MPTHRVLLKLAAALQVDVEILRPSPTADDIVDELHKDFPPEGGLSTDEEALIRLLRCAPDEILMEIVRLVVGYIESDEKAFRFMDEAQSAADLARLYKTLKKGDWVSGASPASVVKLARFFSGDEGF